MQRSKSVFVVDEALLCRVSRRFHEACERRRVCVERYDQEVWERVSAWEEAWENERFNELEEMRLEQETSGREDRELWQLQRFEWFSAGWSRALGMVRRGVFRNRRGRG